MPVGFLSNDQRDRYAGQTSAHDSARYFYRDDTDHVLIAQKRGAHDRPRFAVQLGTVRYVGAFLEGTLVVPTSIVVTSRNQCLKNKLQRS